jgi:eukaryotic-like serine/threonine-protein kinase
VVPFDPVEPLNSSSESRSPSDKWQISPDGGRSPRWREDGKEIFYLSPANQMMSAQVEEKGNEMRVRAPQVLFESSIVPDSFSPYDVTPDGKKFVINTVIQQISPLTIVVNWAAKLRK